MEVVREKFGFKQVGGLRIPFDEEAVVEFLGFLEEKMKKKPLVEVGPAAQTVPRA
ncbi:hypothetical protein QJS04_geneDACA023845 [Acorus gramineus]|uniref:Uncharacterized protein n=1 Tax=Acorus gramineus TaxID=55184 RepID=A0AAV9BN17_ACOGR|nr:hypothetical protein QJS04_geneDACA023845 [Acorus gramineus]